MQTYGLENVKIIGGFMGDLQKLNADVSVYNVYKRFEETGRFDALKCHKNKDKRSHIYWDSDIAKWLEGVAYILKFRKDTRLQTLAQKAVNDICANQLENGYFNSYFQVYEPQNIFRKRTEHELYCAGHLIEAGIALRECGVDDRLYYAMCRYADYIYDRFYIRQDTGFWTCGHPEIELALVRLYEASGERRYLNLALWFIDERGKHEEDRYEFADIGYHQDRGPVREQKEAEGHAVRALYLYTAMADLARIEQDSDLAAACTRLFQDIIYKKMFLTGGIGSTFNGENFTFAYDLPNFYAYSETCAGIALALFCDRMSKIKNNAIYHAIFERVLYNNILAGESADGKGFFYVNPLEMHLKVYEYNEQCKSKLFCPLPRRVEVFDCSCCPPNFIRFIESIGNYIYGEENGIVYINQYITSELNKEDGKILQFSQMPFKGRVHLKIQGKFTLGLRIPAWQSGIYLKVNGVRVEPRIREQYILIECNNTETDILLDFRMKPRFVYANENIWADNGRKAVEYGPMVLCGESVDNGENLRSITIPNLRGAKVVKKGNSPFMLEVKAKKIHTTNSLYTYENPVMENMNLKLIPYFSWANRGKGDMQIWWL